MRAQMPGGQVLFTPQVQAAWWDRVGGGRALLPRADPSPARMGRCVPGARLFTPSSVCDLGAQGEWAGAQGGGPGGAVRSPGSCPSPSLQNIKNEVERRLADPTSTLTEGQLCQAAQQGQHGIRRRVAAHGSPHKGPGLVWEGL